VLKHVIDTKELNVNCDSVQILAACWNVPETGHGNIGASKIHWTHSYFADLTISLFAVKYYPRMT